MKRLNAGRIVLGGLLAGVVINTFAFVAVYFMLDEEVALAAAEAARAAAEAGLAPEAVAPGPLLSGAEVAASNAWGFLLGGASLLLYAWLRRRRGPGPRTALLAALAIWGLATLLALVLPTMTTSPTMAAVELVAIGAGTVLGAWQYREAPMPLEARSIVPVG